MAKSSGQQQAVVDEALINICITTMKTVYADLGWLQNCALVGMRSTASLSLSIIVGLECC